MANQVAELRRCYYDHYKYRNKGGLSYLLMITTGVSSMLYHKKIVLGMIPANEPQRCQWRPWSSIDIVHSHKRKRLLYAQSHDAVDDVVVVLLCCASMSAPVQLIETSWVDIP